MKTAPKGVYGLSTNYWSSYEQNLIGAVTITSTVFKNWGRPNQSEQSIIYRLESFDFGHGVVEHDNCLDQDEDCDDESTIRIGSITVE